MHEWLSEPEFDNWIFGSVILIISVAAHFEQFFLCSDPIGEAVSYTFYTLGSAGPCGLDIEVTAKKRDRVALALR